MHLTATNNSLYLQSENPGMISEFFDKKISKCVEKFKYLILFLNLAIFGVNIYFVSNLSTSVHPPAILKAPNPI